MDTGTSRLRKREPASSRSPGTPGEILSHGQQIATVWCWASSYSGHIAISIESTSAWCGACIVALEGLALFFALRTSRAGRFWVLLAGIFVVGGTAFTIFGAVVPGATSHSETLEDWRRPAARHPCGHLAPKSSRTLKSQRKPFSEPSACTSSLGFPSRHSMVPWLCSVIIPSLLAYRTRRGMTTSSSAIPR